MVDKYFENDKINLTILIRTRLLNFTLYRKWDWWELIWWFISYYLWIGLERVSRFFPLS